MEYDADEPRKMAGYVDNVMSVEYWLNYQINDCVGMIAEKPVVADQGQFTGGRSEALPRSESSQG